MKFFQNLSAKKLIIYGVMLSFVSSSIFSVLRNNKSMYSVGKRSISRQDIVRYLNNISPKEEDAQSVYQALVMNALLLNTLDAFGMNVDDDIIYDYIRNNYTKEQFDQIAKKHNMSPKFTYLLFANMFMDQFLQKIVDMTKLSESKISQIVANICTKKKAYYKYLDKNTPDVCEFNKKDDNKKIDFLKNSGFTCSDFVSYQSHFQNNVSCDDCKYAKKLCKKCATNTCLCNKCFREGMSLTRDQAAAIMMSPKGEMRFCITPDNKALAVYVFETDQDSCDIDRGCINRHIASIISAVIRR